MPAIWDRGAAWISQTGCEAWALEQYEPAFRENAIDDAVLARLTRDDLKDIGVAQVGHRRKLLDAIAALGEPAPAPSPPAEPVNPPEAAASGERRQLTVMFCDLVGSTALSEKLDPEELRSLLHAYRTLCGDVIARYDGFVARYVGDGILTYFGWPTAHEEDAERAVRAALEIVHTVKRASSAENLSVRISIATGPVVVGETAGVGDQSKLAVGTTPNLRAFSDPLDLRRASRTFRELARLASSPETIRNNPCQPAIRWTCVSAWSMPLRKAPLVEVPLDIQSERQHRDPLDETAGDDRPLYAACEWWIIGRRTSNNTRTGYWHWSGGAGGNAG